MEYWDSVNIFEISHLSKMANLNAIYLFAIYLNLILILKNEDR